MMLLYKQQCLILGVLLLFTFTVKLGHGKITPQRYIENDEAEDDHFDAVVEAEVDDDNDDDDVKRFSSMQDIKALDSIATKHPLDPMNAFEMRLVGAIVRLHDNSAPWQFKFIGLREPDKAAYYPYFLSRTDPPAGLIPRRANVLLADPVQRIPIWVVVNLSSFKVESWVEAGTGEKVAAITVEDNDLASQLALSDINVFNRIQALGYNGITDIITDVWDAGYVADNPIYAQAQKLVAVYFYGTRGNETNFYGHPLDFVAYVELGANKIRGIENLPIQQSFNTDNRQGNSVPSAEYPYFPEQLPPNSLNSGLNPLKITQPDGPSFKINGREVTWQNFQFRVGYNPREGGHIYTVSYNDKGVIRPIVYRLSISEMYLQYGDPRQPYQTKSSFDESNGEFGSSCRALPVHQFCRGEAYYFEADHHNEKAETWITRNSICVVEEDEGILWAHYDDVSGKTAVTRKQRLSVSFHVAVGNTDYWVSYRFSPDATIEVAIKLTGIASTNLMAVDVKSPPYGNLLAPQIYTESYQLFCAIRADVDVDGINNSVAVEDIVRVTETVSPTANPYGNGLMLKSTLLQTAGESPTDTLPSRTWRISNPSTEQALNGMPKGYRFIPQGDSPTLLNMLTPDSPIRSRIPWANHSMWVTPYDPDQIFIGGKYLSDGVDVWTSQENAANSIVNTDVVLWHVFGIVYISESEDWPVLSGCLGLVNFRLRPSGFFSENPALYVPPAKETTALDGGSSSSSSVTVTSPSDILPVEGTGAGWHSS